MSRSVWSACSLLPLSPVRTARKLRKRPKAAASCTHSIRFATFGRAKHIRKLASKLDELSPSLTHVFSSSKDKRHYLPSSTKQPPRSKGVLTAGWSASSRRRLRYLLRRKPFNLPAIVGLFDVAKTIMQAAGAALPKLNSH